MRCASCHFRWFAGWSEHTNSHRRSAVPGAVSTAVNAVLIFRNDPLWDHVVFPYGAVDVADPWLLLTLAAAATERIRLGPLVTPVARRRPGVPARQTTSLDRLSGGRLIFGAGLGFTLEAEYGTWGEPTRPGEVAERLDEGPALLSELWSGEKVDFRGKHFRATDVMFTPTPIQRPRPPVWIGGNWPNRRPLRRAAQWDGVAPMIVGNDGAFGPTPEIVAELVSEIAGYRDLTTAFDVVITVDAGPPR